MHRTKRAGPNLERAKSKKTHRLLPVNVVNDGVVLVVNSEMISEEAISRAQRHRIAPYFQGRGNSASAYRARYEHVLSRLQLIPLDQAVEVRITTPCNVSAKRNGDFVTKAVMREIPQMSIEQSHALSRRMFARTAEDMAQELYDDAE